MRKTLLFLMLLIYQNAYFQSIENKKSIDSLLILAKNTKIDTLKIDFYNQICKKYYIEDPSKMKQFNDKIYALSKKLNYTKGFAFYYLNLTDIDYINGEQVKAIADGEKAYQLFSKTNDIKNRLNAATYLAYAYYDHLENDKARKLLNDNFKIAHRYKDPLILGKMFLFYGQTFEDLSPNEELKNYKKALYYYDKTNDVSGKGALFFQIASVYKKIHLYDEALKYLNLASNLKMNKYNYTIFSIEKARVYNKMERYADAKTIALKNEKALLETHQNFSSVFWVNRLCIAISNFGLKEYEGAIKNAKTLLKADIDEETKMAASNIISHSYLKLKNIKEANYYINQSLKLAPHVKSGDNGDTYLIKSKIEEALGNYKMALFYNQKYSSLNNKRNAEINKNKTQQLQVDFEVAEKENKIKKLQVIDLQKTLEMERQRNYLTIALFIIGISVILILVFIKVTQSINKRNKKIETANIELSKASIQIQKSLSEKELLLKEIHHRVKNNFQLVTSLLNIQAREGNAKDINEFLEKGQSRIISMALIHENLYQTDKLDKVNFQDYIENLITNVNTTFSDANSKITSAIKAENINFDIQTSIPLGLIINELYCNILKHAYPDNQEGTVVIELTEVAAKDYRLKISDDGQGMKERSTTKKTLGIELVHLLVDQLKGTVQCYEDHGTTYCITFKEIA